MGMNLLTIWVLCSHCERVTSNVQRVHQRTFYVEEHLNWFIGCADCRQRNDEHWDEAWASYYSDVL